jgi:Fur family ferric uptake transcriptional regulator
MTTVPPYRRTRVIRARGVIRMSSQLRNIRVTGHSVEEVLAKVRERGGRLTTARRQVVTALLHATYHQSAEDLTAAIRVTHPDVHLTTVYRTLESLEEMGIVAHTHVGHGAAVYHVGEAHQHLACEVCGKIRDVPVALLDDLRDVLARDHGFRLHAGHFALLGNCAEHA